MPCTRTIAPSPGKILVHLNQQIHIESGWLDAEKVSCAVSEAF